MNFIGFLLLMISNFMPLWSEKIPCIFIFLNLLRLDLWPNIWSILENVPCTFEKNVYSIVKQQHKHIQNTRYSVLYMFVLFKSSPYLLSGCFIHYYGWGTESLARTAELFLPSILSGFASYSLVIKCVNVYHCSIFLLY